MRGKLCGVGIGPGDPELLTLKAIRVIRTADIIAVPGKKKEESTAYQIAFKAIPEICNKTVLQIEWPMTKDRKLLNKVYADAAKKLEKLLNEGKTVAFLTLGDPCIYSTYLNLHRLLGDMGFETEIINGVPSFCAAAAKLNVGLVEKNEAFHIIPAADMADDMLNLSGTKVMMKTGKKMKDVKEKLLSKKSDIYMVENCGMEGERVFHSASEIPDDAGYYSLVIIKE